MATTSKPTSIPVLAPSRRVALVFKENEANVGQIKLTPYQCSRTYISPVVITAPEIKLQKSATIIDVVQVLNGIDTSSRGQESDLKTHRTTYATCLDKITRLESISNSELTLASRIKNLESAQLQFNNDISELTTLEDRELWSTNPESLSSQLITLETNYSNNRSALASIAGQQDTNTLNGDLINNGGTDALNKIVSLEVTLNGIGSVPTSAKGLVQRLNEVKLRVLESRAAWSDENDRRNTDWSREKAIIEQNFQNLKDPLPDYENVFVNQKANVETLSLEANAANLTLNEHVTKTSEELNTLSSRISRLNGTLVSFTEVGEAFENQAAAFVQAALHSVSTNDTTVDTLPELIAAIRSADTEIITRIYTLNISIAQLRADFDSVFKASSELPP